MTYKDRLQNWIDERKFEEDNGTWWIVEPGEPILTAQDLKEGPYTEEQIDDILWKRAMILDATDLYGVDA